VPDGSSVGLASVLNIASPIGNLTDVNVTLNLSNGWNGDLYAYLVHDSGFTVLLNRTGKRAADAFGYNDPGFNVTLDDQAAQEIHSYRLHTTGSHTLPLGGPLTGSWRPDGRLIDPAVVLDTDARTEFLSSFNGLNPNGEWVLYVEDEVTGDVSTLVNWSLELCGDAGVAPVITGQPQGQTVTCGTPVTLSVTNTGTAPVGYHWRANGGPVPGANTANLSIPSAHNRLPVAYSVIVSNAFGSVTSAVATVTVTDVAPVINTQPASRTNLVGTTATFTVIITSCSEAAFQWCKGVTPISGATNATLTLANVQLSDAGGYLVKITNAGGTVTSATATLTVNRAPIALPNGGATIQGQALPISLIKLLSNDSDPDGDPITVTAVTATSTNGGSVMLSGGYVTYTPLPAFTGLDRYSYTISDGRGGLATTNVEILIVSKDLPSANQVVIIPVGAGFLIRFAGIPGVTYRLQRAPAVNGPWTTLTTTVAPLHGIIDYLDANPPPGAGFYRTVSP
jgi:subtilisin-like proprotein convertase family protein